MRVIYDELPAGSRPTYDRWDPSTLIFTRRNGVIQWQPQQLFLDATVGFPVSPPIYGPFSPREARRLYSEALLVGLLQGTLLVPWLKTSAGIYLGFMFSTDPQDQFGPRFEHPPAWLTTFEVGEDPGAPTFWERLLED